ncbi:hypothetical protein P9112_001246 [Eukaryota sp. TZLM1-RC]
MGKIRQIDPKTGLSDIAQPLASDKFSKKCLKLTKKAAKGKFLRRGIREVVKAVRRDTKGVCFIAGNINPMDVIVHLPVFCEEKSIPYVFVPSKEELGVAAQTKRPTSCVLVVDDANFPEQESFADVKAKIESKYAPPVSQ